MTELSRICGPATKILGMCQCFLEMSCIHLLACSLLSVGGDWWFTVILEHARDIRIKKNGTIGVCITTLEFFSSAEHFVGGQHCGQLQSKKCCIKMYQVSNIQWPTVTREHVISKLIVILDRLLRWLLRCYKPRRISVSLRCTNVHRTPLWSNVETVGATNFNSNIMP